MRGFDPEPLAEGVPAKVADWRREDTISATVRGADWVVCCLPERLELMQKVIQRAQAEAPEGTIVAVASRAHDVEAIQGCALRPALVVHVDETADGGVGLNLSARNDAELKAAALATIAEVVAVLSLDEPEAEPDQRPDAESA